MRLRSGLSAGASSLRADFVLDTLEQALYDWGGDNLTALVRHSDSGSQYLSIRYTDRLAEHRQRRR